MIESPAMKRSARRLPVTRTRPQNSVIKRANVEVKDRAPQDQGPVFTAELPSDVPEEAMFALRSVPRTPPRRVRWDKAGQRWVDVPATVIKGDDDF